MTTLSVGDFWTCSTCGELVQSGRGHACRCAAYVYYTSAPRQLETEIAALRAELAQARAVDASELLGYVRREMYEQYKARAEAAEAQLENERMKVAGCSTAAQGGWKEGDGISPAYDCAAIHDVAALYARMVAAEAQLARAQVQAVSEAEQRRMLAAECERVGRELSGTVGELAECRRMYVVAFDQRHAAARERDAALLARDAVACRGFDYQQRGDTYRARARALAALCRKERERSIAWLDAQVALVVEAQGRQRARAEAAERELAALRAACAGLQNDADGHRAEYDRRSRITSDSDYWRGRRDEAGWMRDKLAALLPGAGAQKGG